MAFATAVAAAPTKDAGKARDSKAPAKSDPKAKDTKSDPKAKDAKADPRAKEPAKADPKSKDAKDAKPEPKAKEPAKPDPKAKEPAKPAPAPAPPPAPAPAPTAAGYWVGAQLLGPGPAQTAAAEAMSLGTGADAPSAASQLVGQVATVQEALHFVARWAFAGAPLPPPGELALREDAAPVPGGDLLGRHGAVLYALTVLGRSADGGTRAIKWPQDSAELLPEGLAWRPGALLVDRAPLFAAPAPRVPPASERFALARRSGNLFVLGAVDRCTRSGGPRECLRWLQVVVRDGERFHAGYLPAFQVGLADGWRKGQGALPRAQLIPAATRGDAAVFVLVARARDNGLHRQTVQAPLHGDAFPAATLRVEGDWAVVEFAGAPARRIALDASMDARPR